jgi:hypothetical protein
MKTVPTRSYLDEIVEDMVGQSVPADQTFFVSWRIGNGEDAGHIELGTWMEWVSLVNERGSNGTFDAG